MRCDGASDKMGWMTGELSWWCLQLMHWCLPAKLFSPSLLRRVGQNGLSEVSGKMRKLLIVFQTLILFVWHVKVTSFILSRTSAVAFQRSKPFVQKTSSRYATDASDQVEVESNQQTAKPDAIMSERVMNQRLIEMGSEPIDFELLKKTIAEWSKPLPKKYFSQPLVLVGPSGVGKGRLVKALLKDYKRFFAKIVTHTTRR